MIEIIVRFEVDVFGPLLFILGYRFFVRGKILGVLCFLFGYNYVDIFVSFIGVDICGKTVYLLLIAVFLSLLELLFRFLYFILLRLYETVDVLLPVGQNAFEGLVGGIVLLGVFRNKYLACGSLGDLHKSVTSVCGLL